MAKMNTIWKLRIRHAYYRDEILRGLRAYPSPDTRKLLERRNYLFRNTDKGEWNLVDIQNTGLVAGDVYQFYVESTDINLLNITRPGIIVPEKAIKLNTEYSGKTIELADDNFEYVNSRPGIFFDIHVKPQNAASEATAIYLPAAEFYWEYIFIFRQGEAKGELLLEDMDKILTFTGEKAEFHGSSCMKFRSVQKIPCKEIYPYKLVLSEMIRERKKELIHRLSYPEPGMFLDAPPDVIRQIVYV